jgi:RHS repeat-associated protein
MEKEDEIANTDGADLDFEARIYDARLGRFLSRDPLSYNYPFISPYNFSRNNPILFIDEHGMAGENPQIKGTGNVKIVLTTTLETSQINAMKAFAAQDQNWDYIFVEDFVSAESWINSYTQKYGKLSNIAVRSHGSYIIDKDYNPIDHGIDVFFDGKGGITESAIQEYKKGKGDPEINKQIKFLENLGKKHLKKNANVIFGACGIGHSRELQKSLFKLFDPDESKNITVWANQDVSDPIAFVVGGKEVTPKEKQYKGWVFTDKYGFHNLNQNGFRFILTINFLKSLKPFKVESSFEKVKPAKKIKHSVSFF